MDHLQRSLIVFASLFFFLLPARANFPASIQKGSYCYSTSASSYGCVGPKFDTEKSAALYACIQLNPTNGTSDYQVTQMVSGPGPENGLSAWGTYWWGWTCSFKYNGATYSSTKPFSQYSVQALPDCTGGAPILQYSPATCSGQPAAPPVACNLTGGVLISAYHTAPTTSIGCYAGCNYTATQTAIVTYNGVNYESGTWTGGGGVCQPSDIALTGGAPGNSQNVGNGGGLVPGDLAPLAKEASLQNLISAVQQGTAAAQASTTQSTVDSQAVAAQVAANNAVLQQIATNTSGGGAQPTSIPDPDGLQDTYTQKTSEWATDANGKLPDSVLGTDTVDVSNTFANTSGFIGGASCPQIPGFSVLGHAYNFDITIICSLAQALSYLVVTLAAVAGVKIFASGV